MDRPKCIYNLDKRCGDSRSWWQKNSYWATPVISMVLVALIYFFVGFAVGAKAYGQTTCPEYSEDIPGGFCKINGTSIIVAPEDAWLYKQYATDEPEHVDPHSNLPVTRQRPIPSTIETNHASNRDPAADFILQERCRGAVWYSYKQCGS